jgi:hypothetical protein
VEPTCSNISPITASRDNGEAYLELALRLGKLEPDLVDSYSGPAELAARVDREKPTPAAALAEQVVDVRAQVEAEEPDEARRRWLGAQLDGLETACRALAGQRFSYRELVQHCYGVEAERVPDEAFAAAHRALDPRLPGDGPLRDRYERWLSTQLVPPELLQAGLEALTAELRRRTDALFGLPEGDHVELELVTDKPWGGHCEYLGDLRTRISINTDLPIASLRLLELVAHEIYPGHHTEHVCKEALLRDGGRLELAVYLYPTPQALVAEGLAQMAHEALLGDQAEAIGAAILHPLGIPYDADTAAAVRDARNATLALWANVPLLVDEGELPEEEAFEYARRWSLEPDAWVEKGVKNILTSAWRPYASCYPQGVAVCRRFVGGDAGRFKRLLSEQLTTEDLL